MKQKVTIADVAKHCQVSKSSVSRYLNHGYVSAEHKEKIKQAIEELGFERDFFASRLKAKHTRLIGIVVRDMQKEGHAKILEGMQKKLKENGYQGIISISTNHKAQEAECLQNLILQGVDGVVFLDCTQPEHLKDIIEQHHVKAIFANHKCNFAPFLSMDEKRAGKVMGEYLMTKHAQKLVLLETEEAIGKQHKEGIESAYGDASCSVDIRKVKANEAVVEIMKEIVAQSYEVIVCGQKKTAQAILRYAQETHIHIPQNVSLACFGDGEWCEYALPSITALAYDDMAFGENLIEEMVAINETREPVWKEIAYTVKDRESVRSY